MQWRTWRVAMGESLYGANGFYRTGGGPAAHFRTSPQVSVLLADALLRLASLIDERLGHPEQFSLVDMGAGGGELLAAMAERARPVAPGLAERLALVGVDIRPRPDGLAPQIGWVGSLPHVAGLHVAGQPIVGLLVANEWLDNVQLDVAVRTDEGPRLVQVNAAGEERLGPPPTARDLAWLARWWPGETERAEIGVDRDEAWAHAVGQVDRGLALAIDYALVPRQLPADFEGTLTGYRDGRQVRAVPDGTCDLTAHVVLESAAAQAGGPRTILSQREALIRLGLATNRPPRELAATDPAAYLQALAAVSCAGTLVDPAGLGGFSWLAQPVGIDDPFAAG